MARLRSFMCIRKSNEPNTDPGVTPQVMIDISELIYSCADWDSLRDHLRDVPWEDIFKLSAPAAANEICQWVQVGIDV